MSAITSPIGISSFSAGLIDKVTTSRKTTVKVIRQFDSSFGQAATFDPISEFEVSGYGSSPVSALGAVTTGQPNNITGGVIILTTSSEMETSEDFNKFSYKGTQYPGAS